MTLCRTTLNWCRALIAHHISSLDSENDPSTDDKELALLRVKGDIDEVLLKPIDTDRPNVVSDE